ncbi:hypothetical protein B0T14DRAFT_150500 [Immersiella caudata]|uniref:Uncharacterized protein n=1 Tax=Immersiella caudata TaxID=314043 RepID=A0AA40C260_9PEZI|nr:hypothetical protein B0T14DRAFT_150500 [Immersiella caudata]
MFEAKRVERLDRCRWEPSDNPDLLGFIEAWWVAEQDGEELSKTGDYHYRRGFLTDDEVEDWISQKRDFSPPRFPSSKSRNPLPGKLSCIRILMCERLGWQPPRFAMSQRSYLLLEKEFALSRATLPILCRSSGLEYHRLSFPSSNDQTQPLPLLSIILKHPQMYQLGNLGLSLSHNLTTSTTLAFLHGWSLFTFQNAVTGKRQVSHAERIHQLLEPSVSLWKHPLLLPTLIFQEHLTRCEDFVTRGLSERVRGIEMDLGVTRSGRLVGTETALPEVIRELVGDDERRLMITSEVNTTLTDTITFLGVLKWDQRLGGFIQRLDKELGKYYADAGVGREAVKELEAALEHFCGEAESTWEYVNGMRARLEGQMGVLYNFMAQAGNDLNSRIAATSGLDSAAMKTLAFVTAVFLPPSYIAALFSMTFFNWQAGGEQVVSSRFWIYWVISAPLTVAILVGWRFWWKKQRVHYAKAYPQVLSVGEKEKERGEGEKNEAGQV